MIVPRIGELVESVSILNVTLPYSVEGYGTEESIYRAGVRAKVEPLGGQKEELTQQIQSFTQYYRLWIWYDEGVTAFQEISWGGRRLVITSPPERIGSAWLLINCREIVTRQV
jgi:hypothetical protein